MPTVNDLIAEFDKVFEKKAAVRIPTEDADAVVKLAERLVRNDRVKVAQSDDTSLIAEIAKSIAITDTLLNLGTLTKIAEVEDRARAAGHNDVQIEQFFEKNASIFPMVSVLQLMPWV